MIGWRKPDAALADVWRMSGASLTEPTPAAAGLGRFQNLRQAVRRAADEVDPAASGSRTMGKSIFRSVERDERRSPLFWWMVDHHDQMLKAADGRPINWAAFCLEAAAIGLTDTRGQPPKERNARETWSQARKAVARAREREAATAPPKPGSIYPSRTPADWRPEPVTPGTSLVPASPGGGVPAIPYQKQGESTAPVGPEKPYDWRERVASLKRSINERSGRRS